jgi:hypothetical protein
MDMQSEQQPTDAASNDWIRLRRDDFQQLVELVEVLDDHAPVTAAPEVDEPLRSCEEVRKTIDAMG